MVNINPNLKFFASFFQKRSGVWGETPRLCFNISAYALDPIVKGCLYFTLLEWRSLSNLGNVEIVYYA